MLELTLKQACEQSANFMYIWADERKFLRYIDPKYASIIRTKKANQAKLLSLSAEKEGKTYEEYTTAIRKAFIDQWGCTPVKALVILAQGGQIAGKNWSEGIYGIGALAKDFNGMTVEGKQITVDPTTGHIFMGAEDITDPSKTVISTVGKKTVEYQLFSRKIDGFDYTFMSQYNKTLKKYYAQSYSDDQYTYSAKNGKEMTASESGDIWGTILLSLQKFIDWIISLFGGSTERETISAANTLPNQRVDGFTSKAGTSETGVILLCAAAAGYLMFGGKKKKTKGVKGCR